MHRLSATASYPSWGTTRDKTLFVRRLYALGIIAMNERESHRFGVWTMITSCAAVAVACISATYAFTYNSFKDQLDQYKQSSEWQLPKLLRDLRDISGTLGCR